MAETTVGNLATRVGLAPELLLEKCAQAGIDVASADDVLTDEQLKLLQSSLSGKKTLSLRKKPASDAGANASVNSEASKKLVVKRSRKTLANNATQETATQERVDESATDTVEPTVEQAAPKGHAVPSDEKVASTSMGGLELSDLQKRLKASQTGLAEKKKQEKAITSASDAPSVSKEETKKAPVKEKLAFTEEITIKKKVHIVQGKAAAGRPTVALKQSFERPTVPVVREVSIPETIAVSELAQRMAVKGTEVIKVMMNMGAMATINQVIDQDTAVLVVEEMGHKPVLFNEAAVEDILLQDDSEDLDKEPRAPVVTIMGHVDHGKTTLLDTIRKTKVTAGEAGGITQHIGAYHVTTDKGSITFLDTPGHAAFTAMRARGAKCTDIVVLIVAADDGVMPQTIEAIQHAKAAQVPIIVALNKADKEDADPDRVKGELSQHELVPEDWGGDVMCLPVSALNGDGINDLLEAILLQAEVLELTATTKGAARGVIVESRLDKGRGPVTTVLVQKGTLCTGDVMIAGREFGRVRALLDDTGQTIKKAGPSIPVEVLGMSGTPEAGDEVAVVPNEKKAREIIDYRQDKYRDMKLAKQNAGMDIFAKMAQSQAAVLNIVLKAGVHGSVEAISDALNKISTDEVKVRIVASGVGGITESDANLAMASDALIIGFNVRADAKARQLIEKEGIELRYYSVIYELLDDMTGALTGMLAPELKEEIIGLAEVRDVFKSSKIGAIAGCLVVEGTVKRSHPIRVLRDNVVIFEGELESLRRFKDEASEVKHGSECGIGVKDYNDIKVGDQIEVFETVEIKRNLKDTRSDNSEK